MLVLLHAMAVFLAAALLFIVQPMIAKRLLPVLGGSPSVWNTAMMFFQAALLVGYAGAHLLSRWLSSHTRIVAHGLLLAAALPFLPLTVRGGPPPTGAASPVLWLVGALALSCGIPFLALSTTGPLLQQAFSRTDNPSGRDPYFLYAASNAGSLGGLLAYPFLIETTLTLRAQEQAWSALYVVAAIVVFAAVLAAARRSTLSPASEAAQEADEVSPRAIRTATGVSSGPSRRKTSAADARMRWRERGFWLLCAFVPSSLTLGVTQALSTDLPPIPFLWVVALSIYLGTFIVAFSRGWRLPVRAVGHVLALLVVAYVPVTVIGRTLGTGVVLPLHLLLLAAVALLAHGRLAETRPPAERLTEFYLWIAIGGALGGIFNALLAPLVFVDLTEVPIALALSVLLRPGPAKRAGNGTALRGVTVLDFALAVSVGGAFLVGAHLANDRLGIGPQDLGWVRAGLPAAFLLLCAPSRVRFAAGVVTFFLAVKIERSVLSPAIHEQRTFYGILRVTRTEPYDEPGAAARRERPVANASIALEHGSTRHGTQLVDPSLRDVPTTYYHPSGPIGHVFATLGSDGRLREVAIVGLGAGTLAAYGEPWRHFTTYELDPAVIAIARDERFFTYISRSKSKIDFVPGDGRLGLSLAGDAAYDLIVLDAFTSDTVPMHLLTRDAFDLYLRKLAPGGVVAVHVSNEFLDLVPVVAAAAAELGLSALARDDRVETVQEIQEGKEASTWVVLAHEAATLAPLAADGRWSPPPRSAGRPGALPAWTDESSSLFTILRARHGARSRQGG